MLRLPPIGRYGSLIAYIAMAYERRDVVNTSSVELVENVTSISQINFFLSLVNAKRVLFSPLVIVGFQIFERPSGGRYGGRWISDGYFKSNIW